MHLMVDLPNNTTMLALLETSGSQNICSRRGHITHGYDQPTTKADQNQHLLKSLLRSRKNELSHDVFDQVLGRGCHRERVFPPVLHPLQYCTHSRKFKLFQGVFLLVLRQQLSTW